MDVAVNGNPVIPRHGAAVEMNALWYNAVSFLYLEFGDFLELGLLEKIEYKMQLFENHYIRDIQSGSAVYCQGVYGAGMEYG